MSDTNKVILSIFGSTLTIVATFAALVLTSADHTREQFNRQIELVHRNLTEQDELTRQHLAEQDELTRQHLAEKIELTRQHYDSQFNLLREDIGEVRNDIREIRGEVRVHGERLAKVEALLAASRPLEVGAAPQPRGAGDP